MKYQHRETGEIVQVCKLIPNQPLKWYPDWFNKGLEEGKIYFDKNTPNRLVRDTPSGLYSHDIGFGSYIFRSGDRFYTTSKASLDMIWRFMPEKPEGMKERFWFHASDAELSCEFELCDEDRVIARTGNLAFGMRIIELLNKYGEE